MGERSGFWAYYWRVWKKARDLENGKWLQSTGKEVILLAFGILICGIVYGYAQTIEDRNTTFVYTACGVFGTWFTSFVYHLLRAPFEIDQDKLERIGTLETEVESLKPKVDVQCSIYSPISNTGKPCSSQSLFIELNNHGVTVENITLKFRSFSPTTLEEEGLDGKLLSLKYDRDQKEEKTFQNGDRRLYSFSGGFHTRNNAHSVHLHATATKNIFPLPRTISVLMTGDNIDSVLFEIEMDVVDKELIYKVKRAED